MYLHVSVCEDVCTASKCIWQESLHTGIKGGDRSGFCCVVVFENWVSPVLCMVLYSTSFVERLVEGLVQERWCGGWYFSLGRTGVVILKNRRRQVQRIV